MSNNLSLRLRTLYASLYNWWLQAFSVNADADQLQKNTALVRILFGLGLAHHFIDIMGFAIITDSRAATLILAGSGLILSLFVTVGFLTPIALVLLIAFFVFAPIVNYLAFQIMIIVGWGLFFFGAGHYFSLDSLLGRNSRFKSLSSLLYRFSPSLDRRENVAYIRSLMILLFWGVSLCAMLSHFYDPLWLKGDVLQLVLTTPYLTDFYDLYTQISQSAPVAYDVVWTAGLIMQGIWELLLFPLMFVPIARRFFVPVQGLVFFVFSLIFLNLRQLPFFEICWWLLLFGYVPVFKFNARAAAEASDGADSAQGRSTAIRQFHTIGAVIVIVHLLLNILLGLPALEPHTRLARQFVSPYVWSNPVVKAIYKTFAQRPVNVFNRADLMVGQSYFVIYETDAEGNVQRVVPYLDSHGGRLDYLQNDILYFNSSITWQRSEADHKFVDGDPRHINETTNRLLNKIMFLDGCLEGKVADTQYVSYIYVRDLIEGPYFSSWSEPRLAATVPSVVTANRLERCYSPMGLNLSFNLPPGQSFSQARTTQTLTDFGNLPDSGE